MKKQIEIMKTFEEKVSGFIAELKKADEYLRVYKGNSPVLRGYTAVTGTLPNGDYFAIYFYNEKVEIASTTDCEELIKELLKKHELI